MAEQAERSRDLERVLTFVDAIAAVAITLLVLPLVDLAGEIRSEDDSVAHLLRSHGGQFWGFLLSFAVIARLWLAQHRLMRPVVASSNPVVLVLILWTLSIVFLPFPTALLSDGGQQALTKVLYIGTLTACSLFLALLALVIRRDPTLCDGGEAPSGRPATISAVLLALALVITLAIPATSYYPLLLLLLSETVDRLWDRLIRRR